MNAFNDHTTMAIAELRARVDSHDAALERHERHLAKLDETIMTLREGFMTVATKTDISDLRRDINDKFDGRLRDAHNSIPTKFAAVCASGMFILAAITLALRIHG